MSSPTTGTARRSAVRRSVVRRPWLRSLALFFLAPFIGEFVLGNQPITSLASLLALAPLYGGGAVLIREVARRRRGGWPMIILLAAAYALLEEGPIDQMIFNPAYLGMTDFSGNATFLGISLSLAADSLSLHTVWSICVPIALVEALAPEPQRPWVGRRALAVVAAVFVIGSGILFYLQRLQFDFLASPTQFALVGAVIIGLIIGALVIGRVGSPNVQVRSASRAAPRPLVAGVVAFGLSSLAWVMQLALHALVGPWVTLLAWMILVTVSATALIRASRAAGWGPRHRTAVASGALLTYVWVAPFNTAALGVPIGVGVLGNFVFGMAAVTLVVVITRLQVRCGSAPLVRA